jgi:DivIVA domain-containing protein
MPERLTPVDILNTRFPRRMSGYAISDVDEFVRRVASDMETVLAECASLRERITAQERELAQYRALETTMRDALVMAQKAADETRAAAHAQAAAQMTEANARLSEVNAQIERLHQERRRLVRDLQARLTSQMEWLAEEIEAIPPPAMETPAIEGSVSLVPAEAKTALPGTTPTTGYAQVYIVTETPAPSVSSEETDTVMP